LSKEWRKVPSNRRRKVWNKLNNRPNIPRATTVLLAVCLIVITFFGTAAIYFVTNVANQPPTLICPSGEPAPNGNLGHCHGDPFATIWNGQILNNTNTDYFDNAPYFKSCSSTAVNGTMSGYMTCQTPPLTPPGSVLGQPNPLPNTGLVLASVGMLYAPGGVNSPLTVCNLNPKDKVNGGTSYNGGWSVVVSGTGSSGGGFTYCMSTWSKLFGPTQSQVSFANLVVNFTEFISGNNLGGTPTIFGAVNAYPGATGVGGNSAIAPISTGNGIRTATTMQTNVTVTATGSGIYSFLAPGNCVATPTFNPAQTIRINGCGTGCGGCGTTQVYTSDILTPGQLVGTDNYQYTNAAGWIGIISVEILNPPQTIAAFANDCYKTGYVCFNTFVTNGFLEARPPKGQSQPAIAISNSTVNMSNCVSKSCAFSMALCQTGNGSPFYAGCSGSFYNGEEMIWFLRLNGTMPSNPAGTTNWNPLDDQTVALAVVAVRNGTNTDYGVYIQRHIGDHLRVLPTDDVLANAGKCPVNNNLIICDREPTGGFGFMSLSLNFTGANTGGGDVSGGLSYLCTAPTSGSTWGCLMGGNNNVAMAFNQKIITTFQLPWLNNQQAYHVGWWQAPQPASVSPQQTVEIDTSNANTFVYTPVGVGIGAFQTAPWEVVSYFVPCTPSTCVQNGGGSPTQDTGGFFGWLGGVVGGAWNTISGAVGAAINVLAPVFDLGNSIMNAFIAALIQFFSLFVEGFRIIFNSLGGLFGLGNLGDLLIAVFNNIANFTIKFVEATFGWVVQTVNLLIQFAAVITNFISNGFLTILVNFIAGPVLTFLGLVWTIVNIFFKYSVAPSYLLMIDWLFGMLYVWISGLRGFIAWINFNILLFTKVFRALYFLLQEAYKVILTIIGTLRGSGTGTGAPA